MHTRRERRSMLMFVLTLGWAGFLAGCPGVGGCPGPILNPYNAVIELQQLDITLNGSESLNTSWGSVGLTFDTTDKVLYFNLSVGGNWVIRNLPIQSLPEPDKDARQTVHVAFDLGIEEGEEITEKYAGFRLLDAPSDAAPAEALTAVGDGEVVFSAGIVIPPVKLTLLPPPVILGGLIVDGAAHDSGFPNQEAGVAECVPAGVSNSVKWLNDKYGLEIEEDNTSIETMKIATDWGENGCPFDFYEWKAWYMQHWGLPIATETSTSFDDAIQAVKDGKDVELVADSHLAAVTGIVKLADGRYVVAITHDTAQGKEGGAKTEYITYDPATGKIAGGTFMDGGDFHYFVIESAIVSTEQTAG